MFRVFLRLLSVVFCLQGCLVPPKSYFMLFGHSAVQTIYKDLHFLCVYSFSSTGALSVFFLFCFLLLNCPLVSCNVVLD